MFPHHCLPQDSHGGSPGNGTTGPKLSLLPLATEGEATPGRDDVNPYDRREVKRDVQTAREARRLDRRGGAGSAPGLPPGF